MCNELEGTMVTNTMRDTEIDGMTSEIKFDIRISADG